MTLPVLVTKVMPMIDHAIEREFERLNFNLKAKVSVPKFREMLSELNSTILAKIFSYVNEDDSDEQQVSDDESDGENRFK